MRERTRSCAGCGVYLTVRRRKWCDACRRQSMQHDRCHDTRTGIALVRRLHYLRGRAAQGLPLFEEDSECKSTSI